MTNIKKTMLVGIVISVMLVGLIGCERQEEVPNTMNQTEENSLDSPKELVMNALDFAHISQAALNNKKYVLENIDDLYEIFDAMELQEESETNNGDKEGMRRIILNYQDGSSKSVAITANHQLVIGDLSYKIVNYEEIAQVITEAFTLEEDKDWYGPKDLVMDTLDFENILQVALNDEGNVLKNAYDLYEIFDAMELQVESGTNDGDKAGMLNLILSYQDGRRKSATITANHVLSIDDLSYEIKNYEEITKAIENAFDKE